MTRMGWSTEGRARKEVILKTRKPAIFVNGRNREIVCLLCHSVVSVDVIHVFRMEHSAQES